VSMIARLDQLASQGRTPWHRASAIAKLAFALGAIVAVVAARRLEPLLALHGLAWTLALTSGAPVRVILAVAAYPLVVASLFLIATWGGPIELQAMLLLRPVTSVLLALWLVATTPYPDLFAPLSRVLPRAIADGLFLTYRALFELLGRAERMARALRFRGGAGGPPQRRLTTAGAGLATLVLFGFERSQRMYATMVLRGHDGRVCGCRHYAELSRADLWVAAAAALAVAAVWVLGGLR
jgi:cobalt/nickel transport system permease protein